MPHPSRLRARGFLAHRHLTPSPGPVPLNPGMAQRHFPRSWSPAVTPRSDSHQLMGTRPRYQEGRAETSGSQRTPGKPRPGKEAPAQACSKLVREHTWAAHPLWPAPPHRSSSSALHPSRARQGGPRDAPHPELNGTSLSQEQQQQRLLRAPPRPLWTKPIPRAVHSRHQLSPGRNPALA